MNMKALFFISLCLFITGATADGKPARDYTTVNLDDRLTVTMLNVGTTSFTFSVEWSPDVEFPEGVLNLMSKLDTKEPWWDNAVGLFINPTDRAGDHSNEYYSRFPVEGGFTHGKAIFEILDGTFPDLYQEEMALASKITFSVTIPDPNFTGLEGIEEKLRKMTPDELQEFTKQLDEELKAPIKSITEQVTTVEDGQSGAVPPEPPHPGKVEGERPREPNAPVGHAWLYLAILPLVLAALWLLRRRKG